VIEKASTWNESTKVFLGQLLSLLFGGKYSLNEFSNYLRPLFMSGAALPDSSRYSFMV
jgi:hypothetical protein